jgi:hypothetical protein
MVARNCKVVLHRVHGRKMLKTTMVNQNLLFLNQMLMLQVEALVLFVLLIFSLRPYGKEAGTTRTCVMLPVI